MMSGPWNDGIRRKLSFPAFGLIALVALPGAAAAADVSSSASKLPAGAAPSAVPPASLDGPARTPGLASNALGQVPSPADAASARASDQPPLAPPLPPGSAAASVGGTDGFRFEICNRSSEIARASVVYRQSPGWMVQGWYRVDPGQCAAIGRVAHGWIYHYADADGGGSWSSGLLQVCVRYPGPFQRYDTGDGRYTCQGGEQLKGFSGSFVEASTGTYTWNLNP